MLPCYEFFHSFQRARPNSDGFAHERAPAHLRAPTAAAGAPYKRISWGGVFAGALLALVTPLGLSLLGAGIGLSTIDSMQEQNPMSGIGTGAVIRYGISTLVALYVGGVVAGRLAGAPRRADGRPQRSGLQNFG